VITRILVLLFLVSGVAHAQSYNYSSPLAAPASSSTNITSAITAPNSTSVFKMQGLAGSITPAVSGNVLIIISGTVIANTGVTATHGVRGQISYGTGIAPTSNTALTGTQAGVVQSYRNGFALTAAADLDEPFMIVAFVTGLTPGTAYWIDLAAESITTASDNGFSNVNISAVEIQ